MVLRGLESGQWLWRATQGREHWAKPLAPVCFNEALQSGHKAGVAGSSVSECGRVYSGAFVWVFMLLRSYLQDWGKSWG